MSSLAKKSDSSLPGKQKISILVISASILTIVWTLFWYFESERKLVLIISAAAFIPFLVSGILLLRGWIRNAHQKIALFTIALFYFSTLFAFAIPPFAVPDEFHHYLSSYWLTNCVMGESDFDSPETIVMRDDDWNLYSGFGARSEMSDFNTYNITNASYQEIVDNFSFTRQSSDSQSVPEELMFNFRFWNENGLAKTGSVLGMLLGRLLNLGAYPVFYLGRIFSAAVFVLCVSLAVYLTPVAKSIFIGIAFFPMTLNLAASYSYDGGIIGFSFLYLALLLRSIRKDEAMRRNEYLGLLFVAMILAPCKVIYVLETGLVLLIPSKRFTSKRFEWFAKLSIIFSAMFVVSASKLQMIASVTGGAPLSSSSGGGTNSIWDLVLDPLGTIALLFRSVDSLIDFYWMGAVGANLGWHQPDLGMPAAFVGLYFLILIYSVQPSKDNQVVVVGHLKLACILVFVAVFVAALISMATAWTSKASDIIQGVQGRYLLPALPLLFLSTGSYSVSINRNTRTDAFFLVLLLDALYLIKLIALALI